VLVGLLILRETDVTIKRPSETDRQMWNRGPIGSDSEERGRDFEV
jgi:hypothetical protein